MANEMTENGGVGFTLALDRAEQSNQRLAELIGEANARLALQDKKFLPLVLLVLRSTGHEAGVAQHQLLSALEWTR